MAHPYAEQAKASQKRRLGALNAKPGKAWGSSQMYKKTSYPSKGAGTQRELTISGKASSKRADRKGQVGNFARGGVVGLASGGFPSGDRDKKKSRKPAHTTNIIISHAGGRGGGGGGGGRPAAVAPPGPPQPVPVPRPVPVPVRPPMPGGAPPVGAAGPGPAGPPPVPVRPPMPPVAPPPGGLRPPGMAAGGVVRKAAKGGFLKDGGGKDAYPGFPHAPTTDKGSKPSAHADGGAVKKRAFGGGGLGAPGPFGSSGQADPTPQTAGGLFQGPGPQRAATPAIPGPPTVSQAMGVGRPARPPMPLTVPMGSNLAGRLARPAPGTTVGYSKRGGKIGYADGGSTTSPPPPKEPEPLKVDPEGPLGRALERTRPLGTYKGIKFGRAKGGAVHDDEAQDKKLIKQMISKEEKKEKMQKGGAVGETEDRKDAREALHDKAMKGYRGGGFVPKRQDSTDPALVGGKHHQQGVGMRNKGGTVGTPEATIKAGPAMTASPASGVGRLRQSKKAS